ncbi:MAG: hypothetical protein Q4B43_10885 [Bacteroidota bacterium]|nr:hypothetical protein [Bacteroidota bacterium]
MTLCHLHEKYDINIKRFIFDYPDFRADLKKEIPLGYLINVFLPYMTSYRYNYNKIPIKIQKKYKLLIECLMHYFILIDSIYNEPPFIKEFLDRGDVFDNILKHLIHEQLFSIYQLSDHALGKMLDLFPDNTKGKRLVKYLLDGNNECYNPICKIKIDKNSDLLDFDYNEQSMNVNYINPILHYEKNDRESKPMIFNKKDNVLYFLGSEFSLFNNISWYNFLKNNSNIDDKKYGFIVEDFLCSLFDEKNINYIKGAKYNKSKLVELNNLINKDGECDFIIDNDSYIFFIELKIKRLTSKSQGGDLYSLITDYCKSYLTSINQALNHEVILKYTGKLDLILEDGSHLGINLKNNNGCDRKVERVSLSLFEFNGLQDSRYFNNILSVFREVRFCNNDDKFDKEINSLIEKINNKVKFLNMNINDFMLSNRRISIPQVIELMKMSTNKDEFIHCLNKDRNVTLDSSNDWYRKIYFLRDLEKDQNYS